MAGCILRSEKPLANGCLLRRHDWIYPNLITDRGFPGGSVARIPPVMQETWVQPLGLNDPLEEGVAVHSNILAWRISWTEEPGGSQGVKHN